MHAALACDDLTCVAECPVTAGPRGTPSQPLSSFPRVTRPCRTDEGWEQMCGKLVNGHAQPAVSNAAPFLNGFLAPTPTRPNPTAGVGNPASSQLACHHRCSDRPPIRAKLHFVVVTTDAWRGTQQHATNPACEFPLRACLGTYVIRYLQQTVQRGQDQNERAGKPTV